MIDPRPAPSLLMQWEGTYHHSQIHSTVSLKQMEGECQQGCQHTQIHSVVSFMQGEGSVSARWEGARQNTQIYNACPVDSFQKHHINDYDVNVPDRCAHGTDSKERSD